LARRRVRVRILGIAGEIDNPRFHAAVDRLIGACSKHGKTPGFLAGNNKWARDLRAKSFRMIACSVDTHLMQGALVRIRKFGVMI
jgi:2-keto-3-deoxy-L-rhamnonate aldolase RhmA